jgi:hypothetical protein
MATTDNSCFCLVDFLGEDFFRNQPIRNKNGLWWSCLLTDWDEMSTLYRRPSIDTSYQVSIHLAEQFQRRRLKKIGQSETRIASELLPSLGVRRLSSVTFSHFNLLLLNPSAK